MDRSSNSVKIEKIRRALEAKKYDAALEIAKTVDSARIKSAADLSVVAEAYDKKGIYDTALVYYEQIYLKSRTRRILIHLINLCLKLSMPDMAESYLRDFAQMAPGDFYRHIFRYHIDRLRGEDNEVLIYDLEQLKAENFMEDWAYELAKLYWKNRQPEQCVSLCNDIILWFGSGMYVERARGLRAVYVKRAAQEGGIAAEVRKLVDEGRTKSEVEAFIEEATMPEGNTHYSVEEYNQERFGQPVYEEEGRDVIWNTREFGAVTDEVVKQQNTMDLLRGMQVADQIRMQTGGEHELLLQVPGERAQGRTDGEDGETGQKADRYAAGSDRKGETAAEKAVRRLQREKAAREQEIEDKLLQMIEEGESEEELSKAVRRMTGGGESESIVRAAIQKAQETKKFRPVPKRVPVIFPEKKSFEKQVETEKNYKTDNLEEGGFSGDADLPQDDFLGLAPLSALVSILEKKNSAPMPGDTGESSKVSDFAQQDTGRWGQEQESLLEPAMDAGSEDILESSADFVQPEDYGLSGEPGEDAFELEPEPLYEYPPELFVDYAGEAPLLDACLKKQNLKVEEFFGCFLASPDLRRQIFACMERILEDKNRAINIILTGEERSGKTTLAKSIAKCTQMLGGISSPRVAVIRGDKLNHIDLEVKKQQLRGTTMIVEHAAGMTGEKAAQLLSLNTDFAGETAVILEEERRRMNQFLRGNEELDRVYTNRVHLPEWSVEDCFMQALWMLYSNEYFMTESVAEGFLYAVRNQIEEHQDNPFDAVLNYTDAVLKRADKRMSQMLRGFAMDGKYKEEELTMLRGEDL